MTEPPRHHLNLYMPTSEIKLTMEKKPPSTFLKAGVPRCNSYLSKTPGFIRVAVCPAKEQFPASLAARGDHVIQF